MEYYNLSSGVHVPDYKLLTAEIIYHLPDHPHILQTYVWQEFDISPEFPNLKKFLDFWQKNLDGKLHSVIVAAADAVHHKEFFFSNGHFTLH